MWSSLRRVTNKFCEIIHPDIILRNFKKKHKSDPYSEKDLLSTLSHYITRKEGMDSVIVDKKLNDKHNRKHIKRQSLDTYRERLTPKMLYNLFNNIKRSLNAFINKNHTKRVQRIFAIDGSTENANKDLHITKNYRLNKRCTYSQFKIITLYDVIQKVPVEQKISSNFDERKLTEQYLFKYIRSGDIVIFDAGFYSEKLTKILDAKNIKYIFRIKKNSKLCKQLTDSNPDIITSNNKRAIKYNITYKLSKKNKKDIIDYKSNTSQFYILTNMINIPIEYIKNLYHERWFEEEYFKIIKYYMSDINTRCKNSQFIEQELVLKMVIVTLARYLIILNKKNSKLADKSNNKTNVTVNFKIFLYETGTKILDELLFTKSNKLLNKIIDVVINTFIYNVPNKHNPRITIINKGKWYKFAGYNYDPP